MAPTPNQNKGNIKGPTGVYTFMSAKAGLLSEPLVTDVALIGAHFVDQRLDVLLSVYFPMSSQAGLLSEAHKTDVALVRPHFL